MKHVLITVAMLVIVHLAHAQAPQAIPYQAEARNSSGAILASTPITLRFTIRNSTSTGAVLYMETQSVTTTALGMFNVNVGQGTPVSGTFNSIDWSTNAKFLQVELDPTGGSSYINMGTQQMMSVPFALFAAKSGETPQWTSIGDNVSNSNTGNVGIGTNTPASKLHVADSSVVFSSNQILSFIPAGNPPVSGSGSRMMWYADKAAFRVGTAYNTEWDKDSIGIESVAMGHETKAKGYASTALGGTTVASGDYSTAIGSLNIASGTNSFSSGNQSVASGSGSTAIGNQCTASANSSIAIGTSAIASGYHSVALGNGSTASGHNSVAIGFGSTNSKNGSFVFGDASNLGLQSTENNQMTMRFISGYRLFSNITSTVGVSLAAGGNSWATISDRNKKENFAAVDGEAFLMKIAKFNLTSWNYKGQDPATHRHYGPMAQDFYAAFGKDQYGTVGNDTTISQADMEGVSFVAIHALVKRTEELQRTVKQLTNENETLKAELNEKNDAIDARFEQLERKIRLGETVIK